MDRWENSKEHIVLGKGSDASRRADKVFKEDTFEIIGTDCSLCDREDGHHAPGCPNSN